MPTGRESAGGWLAVRCSEPHVLGVVDGLVEQLRHVVVVPRARPRVSEIQPVRAAGLRTDRLLSLAAAAERPSEPRSPVRSSRRRTSQTSRCRTARTSPPPPGREVTAVVEGAYVRVGSPAVLHDVHAVSGEHVAEARALVRELEEAGRTAVVVIVDGVPVGVRRSPTARGPVPVRRSPS